MNRSTAAALALLATGILMPASSFADKALFTEKKCNKCHTIDSQGVALLKQKKEAVDLSNTAAYHDEAWFKDFLMKKVELKAHEGRDPKKKDTKHKTKWKGSDDELTKMVSFMTTLKK